MVPDIDQGVINGIDSANISLFSNIIAKTTELPILRTIGLVVFKNNSFIFFLKQDTMQKIKPQNIMQMQFLVKYGKLYIRCTVLYKV